MAEVYWRTIHLFQRAYKSVSIVHVYSVSIMGVGNEMRMFTLIGSTILSRERGQENNNFSVQLITSRVGNHVYAIHTLLKMLKIKMSIDH